MPASECAAFLAAINETPDDDAPRLVFADWLDENGHPERAEFIRLQIEMSRLRAEYDYITPRADECFVRYRALLRGDWARPVREYGRVWVMDTSRGFAAREYDLSPKEFAQHAPALVTWFGPGASLSLGSDARELAGIAGLPALACVRRLAVGVLDDRRTEPTAATNVATFCRSPYLTALRSLDFSRSNLTRRLVDAVCDADTLRNLEHLNLARNRLGTAGLLQLAANPRFARLKVLDVRETGASDRGVRALLASPYLPTLERLIVGERGLAPAFRAWKAADRRGVLVLDPRADD